MVFLYYQPRINLTKIKRKARTIPFGYKISDDTDFIESVDSELQALQEAKNYLKTCSYREVAQWLHRKTGRYLSHVGLKRRVIRDKTSETQTESTEQGERISQGNPSTNTN
jgi:hypothetical protein